MGLRKEKRLSAEKVRDSARMCIWLGVGEERSVRENETLVKQVKYVGLKEEHCMYDIF